MIDHDALRFKELAVGSIIDYQSSARRESRVDLI
jgi:hypothetical protein